MNINLNVNITPDEYFSLMAAIRLAEEQWTASTEIYQKLANTIKQAYRSSEDKRYHAELGMKTR